VENSRKVAVAQSLMERLTESRELPHTQASSVRFLKEVVRRDLETLLNTRKPMMRELERYPDALGTVLSYGLEDAGALEDSSSGRFEALQQAVETCLGEFEPRLVDVMVSVLDPASARREIRLQIEAKLPLYPVIEVVHFDTVLDLASEIYTVA
jgi:type VI secretion system protein ImpF